MKKRKKYELDIYRATMLWLDVGDIVLQRKVTNKEEFNVTNI